MSEALQYIYYIFDKLLNWIFNDAEFFPNVTVGWVIITILLFGMVIRSILNLPRNIKWSNNANSTNFRKSEAEK